MGDSYFHEMFWRTFRIAFCVTLLAALFGAPEAYILNRMKSPWRGLFLLVILGPLLISVVARTLGWALLFGGSSGLVNKALMNLGARRRAAAVHVHRDRRHRGAGACADALHGAGGLGVAAATRSPGRERGHRAGRRPLHGAAPHRAAAGHARHPSGAVIVFALAASAFATPAIIGGRRLKVASTLAYDEFLNTLNWPLGAAVAVLLLFALVAIVWGANRLVERRYAQVFRMSRQRSSGARLSHAVRRVHAGADPGRLHRGLHAGRLSVVPDRSLVAALVLRDRLAIPSSFSAFWRSIWLGRSRRPLR